MPDSPSQFEISVVISTYNNPQSLRKVLWGYQAQRFRNFEIIVADDGSTQETAAMLAEFESTGLDITHLWQADKGFRKNRILNKSILAARSPYCIFTDGDCVPRADFVEAHVRFRRPGSFLVAGSHVDLPMPFHSQVNRESILSGQAFSSDWLKSRGHVCRKNLFRLAAPRWLCPVLNLATQRPGVFTGNGSSAWRADALAVNGFDETVGYGGSDKDFGFRLTNLGIRSRMLKFSLINLHLDHDRPWVDERVIAANKQHLKKLRKSGIYWTDHGVDLLPESSQSPAASLASSAA